MIPNVSLTDATCYNTLQIRRLTVRRLSYKKSSKRKFVLGLLTVVSLKTI